MLAGIGGSEPWRVGIGQSLWADGIAGRGKDSVSDPGGSVSVHRPDPVWRSIDRSGSDMTGAHRAVRSHKAKKGRHRQPGFLASIMGRTSYQGKHSKGKHRATGREGWFEGT